MKHTKDPHSLALIRASVIGAFTLATTAQGAITFVDSIADNNQAAGSSQYQVGRWSLNTTVKTLDIDGDNIYGTDGYIQMNTSNASTLVGPLASSVELSPSYTGNIVATNATGSGSHSNSEAMLNPNGVGVVNIGYSGIRLASNTTIPLQSMFSYTMNRDMLAGETIRLGIVSGALPDNRVGLSSLSVVAGGDTAAATIVANPRNGSMDMYFFDITGLSNNDTIDIQGGLTAQGTPFTWATINAVTFDSVTVPEPSAVVLLGIGGLSLLLNRRRRS